MASLLTLPLLTEDAYAAQTGVARQQVFPAERVDGAPPLVCPKDELEFYGAAPLRYDFPAITVTTMSDVVVRGRTHMLTPPEAIVRHGLVNPETDLTPEEFYSRLSVSDDHQRASWPPGDPFNVSYLPEAAAFVDGTATNYAHWLTEVLPRIAAFARARPGAAIPFLVDTDLHPNIMRSIGLVAGPDVVIHRLGADQLVRVGVLHNVSPTGYVPFKLREQSLETIGHGVFAPQALQESVRRLKAGAGGPDGGLRPKLLIRRNAAVRQMANEPDIAAALAARGFTVVEPERLSLDEQIAVYSQAGMIVGATGAAMANLIFCRPDCPIVVMMMKFRHTAYWYWRRMAAAAGAGPVIHVSGPQTAPLDDPWDAMAAHRDYRVQVKDVLDAVETAEALSG